MKKDLFRIIQSPVITEKASMLSERGVITFKVTTDATKADIKSAVESIFGVKVAKVRVISTPGKVKVFRGRLGKRSDTKKALVTLVEGQTLDITAGV